MVSVSRVHNKQCETLCMHIHALSYLCSLHILIYTVLGDLPLPSGLPTSVERCALGSKGISADTRRLLNTTDPVITAKITEALLSVDCTFL